METGRNLDHKRRKGKFNTDVRAGGTHGMPVRRSGLRTPARRYTCWRRPDRCRHRSGAGPTGNPPLAGTDNTGDIDTGQQIQLYMHNLQGWLQP